MNWIKDSGVRPETMKLLEENISIRLIIYYRGLGNDFLDKWKFCFMTLTMFFNMDEPIYI